MCEPAATSSPVDDLLADLARFRRRMRERGNTQAEIEDTLIRMRQASDALEVEFSVVASEFAASYNEEEQVELSPVAWMRSRCHMTSHAAASAIAVGDSTARLAASTDAMTAGRIGFAHLAMIAQTAQAVEASGARLDEARLLRRAEKQTVIRFRKTCAHARHAADAAAFLAAQREDIEERSLEIRSLGDTGCMSIRGFLDAAGAAIVRAALLPLSGRTGADDHRDFPRRLADAFIEVFSHALDTGVPGSGRPQVPQVQVTTTLETLLNLPGAPAAEIDGEALVSTATVERLSCEANVRRILLGPDSAVTDVGRARRLPAPATRRAVELRDRGCVWPGCPATRWLQVHHIIHWRRGGPTETENLCLLCEKHHTKAHEGGWQIVRMVETGEIIVLPPAALGPFIRGPGTPVAA